jgi:hypothetical protein
MGCISDRLLRLYKYSKDKPLIPNLYKTPMGVTRLKPSLITGFLSFGAILKVWSAISLCHHTYHRNNCPSETLDFLPVRDPPLAAALRYRNTTIDSLVILLK